MGGFARFFGQGQQLLYDLRAVGGDGAAGG
jgi:hypothetical protein